MVKSRKSTPPEITVKNPGAAKKKAGPKSFPVVAIGGSAGSFTAFEKFFSAMPADSGMAIVIIMHLDPVHKSQLLEVMQRYTPIPMVEATDGMAVQPNHVYIIPPNKDMGIHNRRLLLLAASKPEGIRQPIDYFFESLANDQWNKSVGVVLSGMGADGETGIRMIKENLGLTVAQDPDTADYDSMPRAAISTNLVDFVLAPEDMPLKIIRYLNHPALANEAEDELKLSIKNDNAIQKILMLLRSQTGNDFSLYKRSTITRRIDRRIAYYQFTDYAHYANHLKDNPEEIDNLFNELLIGVTKFFRDAEAFESLKHYLGELLARKKENEPIRVWIAGCSTGEEAYTVAMLLIELVEGFKRKVPPKIQIYATDLDAGVLEQARVGLYHENIVSEITTRRLKQFFLKEEDRYRVKKELRDIIVFAQQNLIKDPPFIKLDLLCCRNMLIYFTPELQKKIIPLFYYAINPGSIMFLGPAETIGGFTDMFKSLDAKWKLFQRVEGNVNVNHMIDFPFHFARQAPQYQQPEPGRPRQKHAMADIFNKALIDNFLPSSVLVNEKGDILYNNGNTGKYLELPHGETVVNNVLKLAREDLKYALSSSLQQALYSEEAITLKNVPFKEGKLPHLVNIRATAVKEPDLPVMVLIVFEDQGLVKAGKIAAQSAETVSGDAIAEGLKKELVYTKQQLTTTIEQMEGSMERLRLGNEELQSTNEELQSTNEESLTTKEEMQSLNEELMTVNSQYQAKAEELTRLNNDMKNLLDATEVSTLFVDNDLNILRYTPQVRQLFNLIASDVGRPISHVVSNFEHPINEDDIREVIDKLTVKTMDARTKNNDWYRIRIMPYRTLDNYISGAVLTLTLITDYKQMQSSLGVLRDYSDSVVEFIPQATLVLSKNLVITSINNSALKLFGLGKPELKGHKADEFFRSHWQTEIPGQLLKQCLTDRKIVTETITLKATSKTYRLEARPFFEVTDTTPLIVLMINET